MKQPHKHYQMCKCLLKMHVKYYFLRKKTHCIIADVGGHVTSSLTGLWIAVCTSTLRQIHNLGLSWLIVGNRSNRRCPCNIYKRFQVMFYMILLKWIATYWPNTWLTFLRPMVRDPVMGQSPIMGQGALP
jgi:hypothetical protein